MRVTRNPLQRFYGRQDLHFVTFSCYRRRPYLGSVRARNRFVRILDEVRLRQPFALIGYVVMPEHVHLLIGEPSKGNPSKVLQILKQKVSRSLHGKRGLSRTVAAPFRRQAEGGFGLLAAALLRLQCVERKEAERKTNLHAPKSGGPKTGEPSEGLAMEQLVALCERRAGIDCDRFAKRADKPRRKCAPLNPNGAAPKSHFTI